MSNQKLRIAVIGTGGIAGHHMRNLKKIDQSEIAGTCDVEKPRAEKAAAEFGGKAYDNVEQMLDREKPDALLICTPPFARLDPIRAAVERRTPFFCEKPPAFSLDDAKKVQAVVESKPIVHSVGFMYRHKETTDRVKELLAGQTLVALRSTFACGAILAPDFPAWFKLQDRSGGPMLDQAIHSIDLIRYIVGDVKTVHAFGSSRVVAKAPDVTVNDTINVALEFENGLGGTHNHSWASRAGMGYGQAVIEIFCRDAQLLIDLFDNSLTGQVRGMKVDYRPGDDCYVTELKRFIQAVRTNDAAPIRSTYSDAVKTLAVCIAANASAQTGKTVQL
ncbi:MAG TPA: Gfo/Idh/MocA family oxidoreductase [Planctomycetota bacterium]|nr:Gfo/Idh/MocA family oxidoreductase [Planctomycetota bacterium]